MQHTQNQKKKNELEAFIVDMWNLFHVRNSMVSAAVLAFLMALVKKADAN